MSATKPWSARFLAALLGVALLALALVVAPTSTSTATATPASTWGAVPAITLGSNPVELAAGENGSIWVVDSTDATLTEITNVAGVTTPQTPIALASGSNPTGVTVDLDGNVWVGLTGTGQVQQIVDDAGTWTPQTPISVGVTGSTMNLTTSPDGSLWVVFRGTSNVQHIVDNGGGWSAESMLTADRGINELVFDTDGVGWLMHPSEVITELVETGGVWSLDPPKSAPFRSNWGAQGPDGSLYLSDGGCRVVKFLPATQSTPLVGYPSCDTDSLAATSDSSFWLTSSGSGSIDRWSSSTFTMVERFFVGGRPRDLTVATDGSLWSVNIGTHVVHRLAYDLPVASTITSASSATFPMGSSTSLTVTTNGGFPIPTIRITDPLPYGVTLTDNHDGTATLTGVPRPGSEGIYQLGVEVLNGELVTAQDFTLTVPGTPPSPLTVFYGGEAGGWNTCSTNSITSTANANFWIGSNDGNAVYHYTTGPFALAETFPVAGSTIAVTASGNDTVWFIDDTNHVLRSISLTGSTWSLDSPITVGTSPKFLTAGADGSIWVADSADSTVTQITDVAGTVGGSVSLPGTTLAGLTTGMDGSIWVADRNAGALIRIAESGGTWTAGTPISVALVNKEMILETGPDGDIWVLFRGESTAQSVKDVAGTWTAQPALTDLNAGYAYTITAGPGDTMWVGYTSERVTQLLESNDTWSALGAISSRGRTQHATMTDNGSMWWSDGGCALYEWKSVTGVAPAITTPAAESMTIGEYSTITLQATGTPNVTFTMSGSLPDGVSFNADPTNSRATLSGSPSNSVTPGDRTLKFVADNGAYRGVAQTFTLTILGPGSTSSSSSTSSTSSTSTSSSTTSSSTTSTSTTSTTVASTTTSTARQTTTTAAPTTSTTAPVSVLNETQIAQLPAAQLTEAPPRKGAKVRIRMSGFRPRERVQLTVASSPIVVGEVDADDQGAIDTEVEIPAELESGEHHLASYGLTSGIGFSQSFVVEAEDGSALPATGSDSARLMLSGLFVLMSGAVLTGAATFRVRRNPRS